MPRRGRRATPAGSRSASPAVGVEVGAAVARSGQSGDTLTTLYGDPRINLAAGLRSPYPHLWSLPIKTLDPRLRELDAILTGPRAPTWLVVRGSVASWGLSTDRTAALIGSRYRQVADCAGVRIFLHQDVARRRPPCPHPASSARR